MISKRTLHNFGTSLLGIHCCSVLFQEPEGGILHAALGGLSSKELYCRRLLALAQEREGG